MIRDLLDRDADGGAGAGATSRRRWLRLGAAALLAGVSRTPSARACDAPCTPPVLPAPVPAFSGCAAGAVLPPGWQPHRMRPDRLDTLYRVAADPLGGASVVAAHAERGATGLRCDLRREPGQFRDIEFSWRAETVPPEARCDDDTLDDCTARVVVAFDGDLSGLSLRELIFREQVELFTGQVLPHSMLMYVWDSQLPVGTVVRYPRSDSIRYLVVDSGTAAAGPWRHHRRDLVADYRQVFGREPGALRSLGVMTDSDDLGGAVEAWYGDIRLPWPGGGEDSRLA